MIEFRKATKSFGDNPVLRGIDLVIEEGETFAILGKTGAGKSVLLRSVVGLVRLDSGRVLVDGQDVTDLDERSFAPIRLKCGMVFQLPTLFDSLSVGENIAFGLRRHRKMKESEIHAAVEENLELVGLSPEVQDLMPQELSFGQQKRVGLARTVALRPAYLLYDEPTTGLDPMSAAGINALINDMAQKLNVTSIVVTHDIACVRATADRVALLHDGLLIETSEPLAFENSRNEIVRAFLKGEAMIAEEEKC
jgi:phospholipid/cholesterol/gamma-HCH transport system ATP-binding protein